MSQPWTPEEPVTPEVKDICFRVKSGIEEKTGTYFAVYTPLSFASKILPVGTEYLVKVRVGEDECVHAMISAVFFDGVMTYTVLRVQFPKTLSDPGPLLNTSNRMQK